MSGDLVCFVLAGGTEIFLDSCLRRNDGGRSASDTHPPLIVSLSNHLIRVNFAQPNRSFDKLRMSRIKS